MMELTKNKYTKSAKKSQLDSLINSSNPRSGLSTPLCQLNFILFYYIIKNIKSDLLLFNIKK
jgi:hypothetical protein